MVPRHVPALVRAFFVLFLLVTGYPTAPMAAETGPAVTQGPARNHRLLAVGDVMLSGTAERVYGIRGYGHAFQDRTLANLIARSDAAFCNLEHPVTLSRDRNLDKQYTFRGTLESLRAVRDAGFDLVSLANNHIMDYGAQGLADTLRHCRKNRIVCAGAGPDMASAFSPGIFTHKGIRYGLLAYSMTLPESSWAAPERPGTAHPDIARMELDIRSVRPDVDILIVSFHWGAELMAEPKRYQTGFARYAVRCGADAVLGHHPHVLQPIEIYRGRPVFYSLGNFAFGSLSESATHSIAAEIVFRGTIPVQINLYPLNVRNRETGFQTRVATGRQAGETLAILQEMSLSFGTTIEQENGTGRIVLDEASREDPSITVRR
jgi:poly-gamma-glutamate synthesis protein (capsule biosynthesis protein)